MKRPVVLIVGAAAAVFLLAGVGASAHSGLSLSKFVGVQSSTFGDEATGARTEPTETPETLPEPAETPEAPPTAEPADTETEVDNDVETEVDNDVETDDDNGAAAPAATTNHEADHETGDHNDSSTKESGD
jgi:hypothetical protein